MNGNPNLWVFGGIFLVFLVSWAAANYSMKIRRDCPRCRKITLHRSTQQGTWETLQCTECGRKQRYRTG